MTGTTNKMDQEKKMDFQKSTIAHFDLDTFYVSVERLRNPALLGKPVIIGGLSDRGVVASCSYEARKFGVHSAMPVRKALFLCPEAVVVRGDMDEYSNRSREVTQIIAERAPVFEKASIDEHYLDISGMDRFIGSTKWAHELRMQIIQETGLPISFGLSVNKTIAKMATGEAKPNGEKVVPADLVRQFLDPLPIKKIPGVGEKTELILRAMDLSTIQKLSRTAPEILESALGKSGLDIWQKANGIDFSHVASYSEEKSISTERTFSTDTTDLHMLEKILITMVEKIAFRMRKKQKLASVVTVKIRYSNFETYSLQKRIAYTSFDHFLIGTTLGLFRELCMPRRQIRLIGVKLGGLVGGLQQLDLFDNNDKLNKLYLSLDQIKTRYGTNAINRAVTKQHDR